MSYHVSTYPFITTPSILIPFTNIPTNPIILITEIAVLTVKNLAILIFSLSSDPVTSANAVNLSADGPTGISIIANQRIGSDDRREVRKASSQIAVMLMLLVRVLVSEFCENAFDDA